MSTTAHGPLASGVALWILAIIAALFFLRAATQLLIPIVLAILISYVLEPVVGWLSRTACRALQARASCCWRSSAQAWSVYSLRDDAMQAVEALPEVARRARDVLTGYGGGPVSRRLPIARHRSTRSVG